MTREEKAIMYFKDMRKKFCEDYLLGIPKDSVAYKATMAEKEFYDTAIEALEQESYDDAKYHEEHGEVIVDKAVWEDAKRALEQEPKTVKSCDTCKHDEAFGCPSFIHDRCENYSEWEQAESEDKE